MNTNNIAMQINRIHTALIITVFVITSPYVRPLSIYAQDLPLEIHHTQVQAIKVHRQSQKEEDRWADQKAGMVARYRTLQAEEAALQRNLSVLEARTAALLAKQNEIHRRHVETAKLRDTLESHLAEIVIQLERKISGGLPFLPLERSERIEALKLLLSQTDVGIAEKCRRIMEALKVETEYGYTMEVYQEAVQVSGDTGSRKIMADILRVGRLALLWRTPDGKTAGHYDRLSGGWVTLSDRYLRSINDAVEMALQRRTVEMVTLPIGRIARQ